MATSIFAAEQSKFFPHRFAGRIEVETLAGGTPSDPKVAEGWIKTKMGLSSEQAIQEAVAKTMVERGITAEEAANEVNMNRHLNGFKRDEQGLYLEGRCLKAAIKEAASCAMAAGKLDARGWGKTNKGLLSYTAEHIFVLDEKLHLGVDEPSGINQRFVHTFRGSGIQYEEYVTDAVLDFTVISDHPFTAEQWAAIWTAGEMQGIGASRSQGFGRYAVTKWEPIKK